MESFVSTYVLVYEVRIVCTKRNFRSKSSFLPFLPKNAVSMFQIVTFPNDGCGGTDSKNGTCYTCEERERKKNSLLVLTNFKFLVLL